jgi:hypothetical protein
VKRAKLAEQDGKVAVVREVPMEECPACGERWLDWEIARRLDVIFNDLFGGDVAVATRRFEAGDLPAI